MARIKHQVIERKSVNETCHRLEERKKRWCQNEGITRDVVENKQDRKSISADAVMFVKIKQPTISTP
jgi:hypothetical protein